MLINRIKPLTINFIVVLFSFLAALTQAGEALKSNNEINFYQDVKPIIDNRCTVCHGCYDAPCQLKLSSPAGIQRGLSKEVTYQGARPIATTPQRLFIDANSKEEWRDRGFNSVLEASEGNNPHDSLLYRTLLQKRTHALPNKAILGKEFDFSLNRSQTCPSADEYDKMVKKQPLSGMPYGLPSLSDNEFSKMSEWLGNGAVFSETQALSEQLNEQVNRWELFLNQKTKKQRLVARYIYEHWFLAHIHFNEVNEPNSPTFFRLVRSKTPPGQPIEIIATRRPYDDPGVKKFYYRLWQEQGTVLLKTHLPLALNTSRMNRITTLFLEPDYNVFNFPSYKAKTASNPFKAFKQIPTQAKYQFMLDEAQFTIMGFIKGPVCRGQTALSVINDRFWVFFVDPKYFSSEKVNKFLSKQTDNLRLPAESESNALTVTNWFKYAGAQSDYLQAKQKLVNKEYGHVVNDLGLVWQGDGHNKNATLTIFRHFDSATVEQGLIGETPKSAWLIDYALLERIHYLLVAGFDVYGNVGHQFNTRAYMDYLRMEGENNFLSLLPESSRQELRKHWYRNASAPTIKFIMNEEYILNKETSLVFKTKQPYEEFMTMAKQYLSPVLNQRFEFDAYVDHLPLVSLNQLPAKSVNLMPEVSVLVVSNANGTKRAYSLLRNSAHYNILSMFNEADRRAYDEDTLTIVPGFIGDYPGAFWHVDESMLSKFIEQTTQVKSEADYQALRDNFGIRRTNVNFWRFSDELHQLSKYYKGLEYGLFDYNRLQDR